MILFFLKEKGAKVDLKAFSKQIYIYEWVKSFLIVKPLTLSKPGPASTAGPYYYAFQKVKPHARET